MCKASLKSGRHILYKLRGRASQHIPQAIRIESAALKGEQPNRQPYKALRALTQNFLGPTIPAT